MAGKSRNTKHSVSNLVFSVILFTYFGPNLANGLVSEAEQIALESTSSLLASPRLVQRIAKHLTAIRAKYPQVADVTHQGKWAPGQVLVGGLDTANVDQISTSEYGPLEQATILFGDTYLLTFSRPYNPEVLAKELLANYPLDYAEPNGIIGTSQTISFTQQTATRYEYTFMKGSGDCQSGCIEKHFWVFSVSDTGKRVRINLESESGSDPEGGSEV